MNSKEYKMPDGRTVVFWYDENQVGQITLEAMDTLISMIAEQWIPCSERLPYRNGEYLVTTKYGQVYQDTFQFLCQWDDNRDNVIAWMPLPKPYQEDKQ